MALFVWAPQAERGVEISYSSGVEDWARAALHPLTQEDIDSAPPALARTLGRGSGWWVFPHDLEPGTRYSYSLDGGMNLPDPRSRYQPEGAHGPSQIVDVESFKFSDFPGIDPLGKVFYELHIGTFTPAGTFDSAAEKLPYLRSLGVDVVEVMPIQPVPGKRNWGYDGVDLYAVTANYGGPAAFARFVEAAHQAGLGVCLDVVYNHFGADGNYLAQFGPYFTEAHHTPWGAAINFDGEECQAVRQFFVDNALQWVRDYRVDVLRLDAVHAIIDDSERHILAEISDAVAQFAEQSGRRIGLVAESDLNDPAMVSPTSEGGYGMDMQWTDDVHHALHVATTDETFVYYHDFSLPGALEKAMRHVFAHDGNYSSFRKKNWGKPVSDAIDSGRFLVYTENHDQVGNRAIGDRRGAMHSLGALAAADALATLSPFSYMIFQGQEWASSSPFQFFTDHDEELGALVDEGRAHEFEDWDWMSIYGTDVSVPSPQAETTFAASHLDWSESESEEHAYYLQITRELLRLRRESQDFASSDRVDSEVMRLGPAGYYRRGGSFVAFNLDDEAPATVTLPRADLALALAWNSELEINQIPARGAEEPPLGIEVHFPGPGFAVFLPASA